MAARGVHPRRFGWRYRPLLPVGLLAAAALAFGVACDALPNPFTGPAGPDLPPANSGSPALPGASETILAEAIENLRSAKSFRFETSAVHRWNIEGRQQEWVFVGEGAYQEPGLFYSRMEGPADADLRLTVRGSEILAMDSKGVVTNPSLAFGGPGNGASPFTVIAYLRNYQQASGLNVATLNNEDVYRINFVPNLASVAALDTGQGRAMARVNSVEGQVWVDRNERRIRQQQVTVNSTEPAGGESSVEITMRFSDFDRPVDIKNP